MELRYILTAEGGGRMIEATNILLPAVTNFKGLDSIFLRQLSYWGQVCWWLVLGARGCHPVYCWIFMQEVSNKSAWSSILGLYQETSPSDPMLVIRIYVLTIVACCKSQLLKVALFIEGPIPLSFATNDFFFHGLKVSALAAPLCYCCCQKLNTTFIKNANLGLVMVFHKNMLVCAVYVPSG